MDKKEFQSLVLPLNEKELLYKENPDLSERYYRSNPPSMIRQDGTLTFLDVPYPHGQIIPEQKIPPEITGIVLSKQTRFSNVPLHRHTWLELNYVYEGRCIANINGTETSLEEGDVCIMDIGVIHTIYPTHEDDIVLNCRMQRSYFNARFIERLTQSGPIAKFLAEALNDYATHDQYLIFRTHRNPLIRELFEDVFCEYLDPAICSNDVIDSYMTLLFIQLARCYQDSKEKEYRAHRQSYITEVLRYVEKHCTDCTLTSTAEKFNFHPKYLSRLIHNSTGQTFKSFVTQSRLKQVAFLLQNTDQRIGDIAVLCGWSNQGQFYKKFSEVFGCTPKEYRQKTDTNI